MMQFDLLEPHLPQWIGEEMAPFACRGDKHADDALIDAATKHHRPKTSLQRVIATADRAFVFEHEEFERYNAAARADHQGYAPVIGIRLPNRETA